jgi:signal transduction histidine kinase
MTDSRVPLNELVADRLEAESEATVERWIDWIQERVGTRTIHSLPRNALRNHIPPVVRALAEYIRSPLTATRASMLGHLELHGRIRRDQGYDINELLAEFDGLAHLLTDLIRETIAAVEQADPAEVLETMERFSTGVRSIGFVTVGAYRELELQQKQRLAEAMRDFASSLSHEMRNPLNTISLGLKVIESNHAADPEKRSQQIGVIQRALKRASSLLQDLRLLAYAENARGGPRRRCFARVIQQVTDELANTAAQNDVRLLVDGALPDVDVDTLVSEIVLINLLGNAVKYSDPDKVERAVRISAELEEGEDGARTLCVRIRDNGLGIPPDLLPHVFKRNFRAHPDRAEGSGLGLTLAKQLIDECGGQIQVESEDGVGSTFLVRIAAFEKDVLFPESDTPHDLMRRSVEELFD